MQYWDDYRLDSTNMSKQRGESSNGTYADFFSFDSNPSAVSGKGFYTLTGSKIICKNELSNAFR